MIKFDHINMTLNKNRLDRLIARITLRLGHKPTQQEIVDLCIDFGEKNFELLISKMKSGPILDDKKIKQIQLISRELVDVPWDQIDDVDFINDDDRAIYSA